MHPMSFNAAYFNVFSELKHFGEIEVNARTNTEICMLLGGHSFKLDFTHQCLLPVAGNRRYYPHIAAAEVAWQFMGTKDPSFILSKAPKLWSKFVEDGELKTAYGYRWREHFGRDQLMLAVRQLESNPTNRQLWIQAWDPATDGLGSPDQPKNIPCPVGFSLSRYKQSIHMSVFIRSSDVFVGLPYDVMAYSLTLDAIAATVGCVPGTIHFTLAHPHLYEPHYAAAARSLNDEWLNDVEPRMPGWSIYEITQDPDGYVATVKEACKNRPRHSWDPMPVVIE